MRVHIILDDDLVADLDRRVGPRQRSDFIASAVRRVLADERRWDRLEAGLGAIADTGHAWDDDPAAWVSAQRFGDERRVG